MAEDSARYADNLIMIIKIYFTESPTFLSRCYKLLSFVQGIINKTQLKNVLGSTDHLLKSLSAIQIKIKSKSKTGHVTFNRASIKKG